MPAVCFTSACPGVGCDGVAGGVRGIPKRNPINPPRPPHANPSIPPWQRIARPSAQGVLVFGSSPTRKAHRTRSTTEAIIQSPNEMTVRLKFCVCRSLWVSGTLTTGDRRKRQEKVIDASYGDGCALQPLVSNAKVSRRILEYLLARSPRCTPDALGSTNPSNAQVSGWSEKISRQMREAIAQRSIWRI